MGMYYWNKSARSITTNRETNVSTNILLPERSIRSAYKFDFDELNRTALIALPDLIPRLPADAWFGNEYIVFAPRVLRQVPRSFKINIKSGQWEALALPGDRGTDLVSLYAHLRNCPPAVAAEQIANAIAEIVLGYAEVFRAMPGRHAA
jgi:hypothetical protein